MRLKHKLLQLILVLVASMIGGYTGFYLGQKSLPPVTPASQSLFNLPLTEKAQMLAAARKHTEKVSVHGLQFDIEITKIAGDWALLHVLPRYGETDVAAIVMERVNHQWIVRDFGTILPGWKEKVPDLFE